ncbi:MAG: EAL domain-containing protein [Terracidiphilus sp.]|jgi:diguanylate cyclase (GGDEF)-like protein/PAS domain S-box-containing protein
MLVRNLSIRFNLTLLILFASGLAVLLASFGFGIYERANYRSSAVRELTALADTLGANSAASLAFEDKKAAQEMLGALATEPHVLFACLYDDDGKSFAEYRSRNSDQNGFILPGLRPDGPYFSRNSLVLFRGVLLNGQRLGSIALVFDLSDLRFKLFEYAKIAALVLLLSILVTLLASLRLAVSIGAPLVQLAAVASHVSTTKDYSIRAKSGAGGETGLLISSFNEMLSQIESRELALSEALKSLRASEERYALAARGANDGLWDWDLVSGEIYFSPRWDNMLGYSVSGVWTSPEEWFHKIHAHDLERVVAEIKAHCNGETGEFVSEYRMRHGSGDYVWMLSSGIAFRDSEGKAIRMAGSQTDITEGKISDPLTQLPNRLYLIDRLQSAIDSAEEQGTLFAVLFLDLDQFKLVNDSLGHTAGDELLVDVAGRLRSCIRSNPRGAGQGKSIVARVGGDEFAILLAQIHSEADPATVSARILERLGEPFLLEGRRMFVSASIGIALSYTSNTPEDLLRNADTAMYQAKANGKGRAEYFNEAMRERVISRIETESGLRKAIDNHQLVLHYQPIVSLSNDRICGFEALVRWNHPERGLIYPGEFIPVAEESDLILLLGRWVLHESCRQMAEWHKSLISDSMVTINVNVSTRQLSDSRFVEDVELALAESGLDPKALSLEVTEGSLMGNTEQTLATLARLKAINVRLEIDDFGTGYSSLSYLQQLPFDTLKIDRSFVHEMSAGNDSADIVKAIVEMAHSLRLKVIAEGVETQEQLCQLRELGCNSVQGFLFSRPVSATIAREIFNEALEASSAVRETPTASVVRRN